MKNTLALVLALAVVSSPAYASRARLEALGEGKNGSYYINDSRNMFLNPASIVKHKKKLLLELGAPTAAGAEGAGDSLGQGGFINTFGDFTYAVYLNNASDTMAAATSALGLQPDSAIEVQLAGEGALNWGVGFTTAGNNQGANNSSYMGVRAGVEKDALAVFATVGLSSKVNVGTLEALKGKLRLDAGATYKIDNMTVFGKYSTSTNDVNAGAGAVETNTTVLGAGVGFQKEMTKSTTMFTRVEADYSTGKSAGVTNAKSYNIPLVFGAETQALSWLAVRGSIGHSLIGQSVTGRADLTGLTTVGAGIGLTFGDVTIDGLVASGTQNGVDQIGMGTGAPAADNFGFGDNMITRIAMTYNF